MANRFHNLAVRLKYHDLVGLGRREIVYDKDDGYGRGKYDF